MLPCKNIKCIDYSKRFKECVKSDSIKIKCIDYHIAKESVGERNEEPYRITGVGEMLFKVT